MDADKRGCGSTRQTSIAIDCDSIVDFDSLHSVFSELLGFPSFYGRNMNAWIDCMSYLDDPEAGMTTVHVKNGETLVINLHKANGLKRRNRELLNSITESSAFVNSRHLEQGDPAILTIAFH